MSSPQHLQMLQELARTHGVELSIHRVAKLEEVPDAIEAAKGSGAEALNVLASPLLYYLVNPVRTGRWLFCRSRKARLKGGQRPIVVQSAPDLTRY
jgi:hypothetical protein